MLKQTIEHVAEKLKNGKKVYLCPAAMETVIVAKMLKKLYNVQPTGFCDNDARKQGRHLNSLPDLKIFSFDEALREETAEFLIISPHHAAAILGDLIYNRHVDERCIIDFQPVERKRTCSMFAHNWIVWDKSFGACCLEKKRPLFDNKNRNPREGLEYLDETRKGMIDGKIELPDTCKTCYNNKDNYIYVSRKLNSFNFSFRGWCNYKCQYCSAHRPELKNYNADFSLEQYLIELENLCMVNDIFSVLYAVGESCLNEKRFGLYSHCKKKEYFLDVFTNCSVFDDELSKLAHSVPVIVRKSFDAGTPETYEKIKGVDFYEKVVENAKRYTEAPFLGLNPKYLFVPGVNDNMKDVDGFVRLCVHLHVDFVTPVFSILDSDYSKSKHAQKMFSLLVHELEKNNIFTANVDTLYSENYHNLYEASFQ